MALEMATDASFFTQRRITEELGLVDALSASVLKNGNTQTVYDNDCRAGDHDNDGAYTCGWTFDLDKLGLTPTLIEAATVKAGGDLHWGDPLIKHGGPAVMWNASFSTVQDIPAPGKQSIDDRVGDVFTTYGSQVVDLDVTDFVIADYETADKRSQFRIRGGSLADGVGDYWIVQHDDDYPVLEVQYLAK